ncbi:hypothetical protein AGMMS50262_22710 [Bacteroidia bacterium]|nr:hypothetical protein AGMMS50262_22710 [Bacteroidia bacterium]
MKLKHIILLFCMLFNLHLYSQEGKKEFIQQLLFNYGSDKRSNTNEAKEKIFKDVLKKSNIDFEEGNYTFIPQFDLVFRKLSKKEKEDFKEHTKLNLIHESNADSETIKLLGDSLRYKELDRLIKSKYLTYINTKKLFLSGMYIFKDSIYYGNLVEDQSNNRLHFCSADLYKNNQLLWMEKYAKIIWQQHPEILFTVRTPFSETYSLSNNEIKVFSYKENKVFIYDFDAYIKSNDFDFGEININTERDKPILCY